jgi:peptidyl-prolyl cis-trans isomerase C
LKVKFKLLKCLTFLTVFGLAHAQEIPRGAFAIVNGEPLIESLVDVSLQANVSRGAVDTPQLRNAIKSELIGQEVLAQEAKKLKLDQMPQAKANWEQMQRNYFASLLLTNHAQENPVSAAQIKNEYEKFLKELNGAKEYKLSIITVTTQARANELIAQLNQSKDKGLFAKLAKAESSDPSKNEGGQLNWLLPQQMLPAVGNVVSNLEKNKLSAVAIQTAGGWNITRVDDIRAYTPPSMTEIEPQLRQAATRSSLAEYVAALRNKSKIQQ